MKRKLFAAAALCLVLLTGCSAVADFRVNRQLDLGEKYLIEEEYDKAMLAYSKALDIEPKEMEAYRGLSDVFTAQKDLESSVNVLKKALAVADDLSSSEKDARTNTAIRGMNTKIVTQLTDLGDEAFKN